MVKTYLLNIAMFPTPSETGYTIFAKSGCSYCEKAKLLLQPDNPVIIDCDKLIIDEQCKQEFLQHIEKIAGKSHRTFPMIFKDTNFIGGYSDLLSFLKKEIN